MFSRRKKKLLQRNGHHFNTIYLSKLHLRKQWNNSFQVLKENILGPKIQYAGISMKIKWKIKIFLVCMNSRLLIFYPNPPFLGQLLEVIRSQEGTNQKNSKSGIQQRTNSTLGVASGSSEWPEAKRSWVTTQTGAHD